LQRDRRLHIRWHEGGEGVLAGFERADDAIQSWESHEVLLRVVSDG
jgi:hypothetical protein